MLASIPDGAPLPWLSMAKTVFDRPSGKNEASYKCMADLTMFDGLPGEIHVGQMGADVSDRFVSWIFPPGGDIEFANSCWVRVPSISMSIEIVSAAAGRPVCAHMEEVTSGDSVLWFEPAEGIDEEDDAAIQVGVRRVDGDYLLIDWDLLPFSTESDLITALKAQAPGWLTPGVVSDGNLDATEDVADAIEAAANSAAAGSDPRAASWS